MEPGSSERRPVVIHDLRFYFDATSQDCGMSSENDLVCENRNIGITTVYVYSRPAKVSKLDLGSGRI